MARMFYIYCLTNTVNGKKYIGRTVDMYSRLASHASKAKHGGKTAISKAIRKYGFSNFKATIIEILNTFQKALVSEKKWIARLRTNQRHGYNQTEGGDGTIGYRHKPETCRKISELRKRNGCSAGKNNVMFGKGNERKGSKNTFWGRHHTKKTKQLISLKKIGIPSKVATPELTVRRILELRKAGLLIKDIGPALTAEGINPSRSKHKIWHKATIWTILKRNSK